PPLFRSPRPAPGRAGPRAMHALRPRPAYGRAPRARAAMPAGAAVCRSKAGHGASPSSRGPRTHPARASVAPAVVRIARLAGERQRIGTVAPEAARMAAAVVAGLGHGSHPEVAEKAD